MVETNIPLLLLLLEEVERKADQTLQMSPRAINRFDDSDDAAATSRHTRETETNEKEEEGRRRVATRVAHVAHAAAFDTGSILSGLTVPGEHTACACGRPNGRNAHAAGTIRARARPLVCSRYSHCRILRITDHFFGQAK